MADSAEEPLMRLEAGEEIERANPNGDINDVSQLLEKNLRNPSIFVWLLTFSAGISGLLFGCRLKFAMARSSSNSNHVKCALGV